jgi:hypothetical protein
MLPSPHEHTSGGAYRTPRVVSFLKRTCSTVSQVDLCPDLLQPLGFVLQSTGRSVVCSRSNADAPAPSYSTASLSPSLRNCVVHCRTRRRTARPARPGVRSPRSRSCRCFRKDPAPSGGRNCRLTASGSSSSSSRSSSSHPSSGWCHHKSCQAHRAQMRHPRPAAGPSNCEASVRLVPPIVVVAEVRRP